MSKVQKDKATVPVQGSKKGDVRATEKWSFKLIKHCYENDHPIPDRSFLEELDDWSMGCHTSYQFVDGFECSESLTDEDCEATQIVED